MRIDFYTKFVLTVIAACLVWLSLGGPTFLTVAEAQTLQAGASVNDNRVLISGWVDSTGNVHNLSDPSRANVPGVPVALVWGGGR